MVAGSDAAPKEEGFTFLGLHDEANRTSLPEVSSDEAMGRLILEFVNNPNQFVKMYRRSWTWPGFGTDSRQSVKQRLEDIVEDCKVGAERLLRDVSFDLDNLVAGIMSAEGGTVAQSQEPLDSEAGQKAADLGDQDHNSTMDRTKSIPQSSDSVQR